MSDSPPDPSAPDPTGTSLLLEQSGWVRQIARSMLRDEEDARDLAQDVMAEALAADLPGQGSSLRAWLRTVTRRLAIRRYRRKGLERVFLEDEERAASVDAMTVERADQSLRLHEELVKALRDLNPADRTLLVQRHVDGISPAELAGRARVSPAVMRKRLSRALGRLRSALGQRLGPDESDLVRSERARRALAVLAAPLPAVPWTAPAPSSPPGPTSSSDRFPTAPPKALLTPTLITMGLQKITAISAAVLVLSGIAYFQFQADEGSVEPVPVQATSAREVAGIAPPESRSGTVRDVAPVESVREEPVPVLGSEAQVELAYVEFRGADGAPRADAFGVWVVGDNESHSLTVGEDGRSAVPAERALVVVAGAVHSRTVHQRVEALRAGDVETIELLPRPRVRVRVTVDGALPGEPLRFPLNAGGVVLAGGTHGMGLQVREELDRMGLIHGFAPMETDASGMIDVELPGNMGSLMLGLPPGFLVNSFNGESGANIRNAMRLDAGPGITTIDLRPLPRVSGRMVWDDTGEPYVGDVSCARILADPETGETEEDRFELQTTSDGRFSAGMYPIVSKKRETGAGKTTVEYAPAERRAQSIRVKAWIREDPMQDWHTFQVDPLRSSQELGEIRVQRLPRARLRILGDTGDSTVPVLAGVASSVEAVTTDGDGIADVCVGPEGWVDVLAPGFGFVRVIPPADGEPPWTVRLPRAPNLNVRMPAELMSADPKLQPSITLRYQVSPFGSNPDPSAPRPVLTKSLYRAVYGLRHEQQSAVEDLAVEFFPGEDGLVTIPGVRVGAAVSVEWTDFLGGVFGTRFLVIESDGEEVRCPRGFEPAFLEATMIDADGALAPGGTARIRGARRRGTALYFETAKLSAGPLAPGSCSLRIYSDTGGRYETKDLLLAPGLNALDIQLESTQR